MILFETERTIVRRFTEHDEAFFFQVSGDPTVMQFIRPPKTREESNAFLQENIRFYKDGSVLGRYAVVSKTDQAFIGTFSYLYMSGDADYHAGYALVPCAWGKGLATELTKAGIIYFFTNTDKPVVFAVTIPENIASQKVLTKSGFLYKGRGEENGKQVDLFYINRNLDTPTQARNG